jgi:hypothetical protein
MLRKTSKNNNQSRTKRSRSVKNRTTDSTAVISLSGQNVSHPTKPMSNQNTIYKFNQLFYYGNFDGSTSDVFKAISHQLNDLPGVTSFTGLYDQYKFDKVECLIFHNQLFNSADSANTVKNAIWIAPDFDDATVWTSLNQALQYQNIEHVCFNENAKIVYVPHIAMAAYNGTFVGYANQKDQWIDCATANVQHYGIKADITAASVATAQTSWKVFFRYHISFRNVL